MATNEQTHIVRELRTDGQARKKHLGDITTNETNAQAKNKKTCETLQQSSKQRL